MSKKVFALVDCNNFYVSCERVFHASIQNRPVVVLSNNDGCIVARSNEAKKLNIKIWQRYAGFCCARSNAILDDAAVTVVAALYDKMG